MAMEGRSRHATVVAYLALFVALGGSSYAAVKIRSKDIANNSVRSADVRNNDLRSRDVRNGSLLAKDFRSGQLPAGATGPIGPIGPAGADGSPDAPAQVLGKLRDVDGEGSQLDADTIDGLESSALVRGDGELVLVDEALTDPDGAGGAKGFSAPIELPGATISAACLQQSSGIEMFLNLGGDVDALRVWKDTGAADPAVTQLSDGPGDSSDSAPVSPGDRVIWHGTSSAGSFTAVLFTAYLGGADCHVGGYVVRSG